MIETLKQILLANITIELPIIPPDLILPVMIGLVALWMLNNIRSSSRAERIQQDAQKIINAQFKKQQNRIDELNETQLASNLERHKLITDNNALAQRVDDLVSQMATEKKYYETMVIALEQSLKLAEQRIEGMLSERESTLETITRMEAELKTAKTQLSSALARIDELEKQLEKTGRDMKDFAQSLIDETEKRQAAEKAYADLQANLNDLIRLAVDEATKPLHAAIAEKDEIIRLLQSRIENTESRLVEGADDGGDDPENREEPETQQ